MAFRRSFLQVHVKSMEKFSLASGMPLQATEIKSNSQMNNMSVF